MSLIDITHPLAAALAPWPGSTPFQLRFAARMDQGAVSMWDFWPAPSIWERISTLHSITRGTARLSMSSPSSFLSGQLASSMGEDVRC